MQDGYADVAVLVDVRMPNFVDHSQLGRPADGVKKLSFHVADAAVAKIS